MCVRVSGHGEELTEGGESVSLQGLQLEGNLMVMEQFCVLAAVVTQVHTCDKIAQN